jgi:MurNAc alpha-1-phosphate uridylyltransferase
MKAMILAAGRGERMRPLTDTVPKPLLPVAGKPLIQYHIDALAAGGVRDIVINLAWLGSKIQDALGDGSASGVRIHYSDEGDAALETGGGIVNALPLLGDQPFIVVSGDVWSDYPLEQLLARLQPGDLAHFTMVANPEYHRRGDFGVREGRVVDDGERLTYANIGVFRPEFFAGSPAGKFPLAPLMRERIHAGRVSGEIYAGKWFNIGTPAQLAELDASLRQARR